jgi:hypothetical protein
MNPPNPQAFEKAAAAIFHVLRRIQSSPELGYYMGVGSESFARLCAARAAITGQNVEQVEAEWAPQNVCNPRKDLQEQVEDLENRLSRIRERRDETHYGPLSLNGDQIVDIVQQTLLHQSHDPERCIREIAALFHARDLPIELVATS